jgi:hypothetical protein
MTLSSPETIAARARAALAFANIKLTDKGAPVKVGSISQSTMSRIVSPTNPRGASVEELWEIADACGVPRAFMEEGFALPVATDLERRVDALERASDPTAGIRYLRSLLSHPELLREALRGEQGASERLIEALMHDALRHEAREPVDLSLPQSLQDAELEAAAELARPPSSGRAGAAKRRARGK